MALLAVVVASTIWVTAPPDPACALADGVTRSLAELLPDATVRAGDTAVAGDLIVRVEPAPGELRVAVSDAQRGVLLARTLPARGSCRETAEAIALIVERYLSDLGWTPATVAVPARAGAAGAAAPGTAAATAATTPPTAATAGTPPREPARSDVATTRPAGDVQAASRAPRRRAAALELGARGVVAFAPVQAGGAIELGAEDVLGARRLRAAVEVGGMLPRTTAVSRTSGAAAGEIEMSSIHALAGAGAALGPARAMVRGGAERLAAAAGGDGVFQRVDRSAWQLVLRADAAYRVALGRAVALEVAAALELRPQPVEITVEDASETRGYPRLRAVVGAGARWRFR